MYTIVYGTGKTNEIMAKVTIVFDIESSELDYQDIVDKVVPMLAELNKLNEDVKAIDNLHVKIEQNEKTN